MPVDVSPANSSLSFGAGDPKPDREGFVPVVGHGKRGADRACSGEDLRLRDVERVGALDVAARDVVADRHGDRRPVLAEHEAELRLGHVPPGVAANANRPAGADRAAHGGVLQEELGAVCVVHERVDVPRFGLRFLDAGVATAFVRDAGAPDLGCFDRRQKLERRERNNALHRAFTAQRGEWLVVVEQADEVALDASDPCPSFVGSRADEADQYVARPPEMS